MVDCVFSLVEDMCLVEGYMWLRLKCSHPDNYVVILVSICNLLVEGYMWLRLKCSHPDNYVVFLASICNPLVEGSMWLRL